jgi:putative PIN family toxin of toxin-antitoxin system
MNVVLDTNVLVSGLLTPHSPCGEIVRMIASDSLTLCLDARLLGEYADVLRRPRFQFDGELVSTLLDHLAHAGIPVAAPPLAEPLPDPDDAAFLAVAIAGKAACLVTGNLKHFPARFRQGVNVLSPKDFLDYYRQQRSGPSNPRP